MRYRSSFVALVTLLCAQATVWANTSTEMQNPGGASTPWTEVTYTFTATSANEVLEFVAEALIASGPEPSPTNFNPPFLDLAKQL